MSPFNLLLSRECTIHLSTFQPNALYATMCGSLPKTPVAMHHDGGGIGSKLLPAESLSIFIICKPLLPQNPLLVAILDTA